MKTFFKNKPFFEISKPSTNGKIAPIYRSKVSNKCQNCIFREFIFPLHILCQNKIDEPMTIALYDYQKNKHPKFIGKYESTVRDFIEKIKTHFDLNCEILGRKAGNFCFHKLEIIQIPTIVDNLKSGINLNMITAFNFTCTKYDSKSCRTFHFMSEDTSQLNEYKKCIMSIGSVFTNYMTNKKYAVYGFGAKMNKKINHCFPLTFNTEKTEENSFQDIIDTYNQAIKKFRFHNQLILLK